MKVRKNDTVLVIRGKDKGKRGPVQRVLPSDNRLVVEGVNMIMRHTKRRPGVRQVGIVQQEAPLRASNVMLVCTHCDKPVRVGFKFLENGSKARACKKCNEIIE